MKKLLLLASGLIILNVSPVTAEEDNSARIAEIEAQIKKLQAELKELKGDSDSLVIVDDENLYIEFLEVIEGTSSTGDKVEFVFMVENKSDHKIIVQARDVSIDGMMVETKLLTMSQDVTAGKKAKAILKMQDYSGGELPELKGLLELDLSVSPDGNFAESERYPASIELD